MSDSNSLSSASAERRAIAGEIPLHALLDLSWTYPDKGSQHAEVVMPVLRPAFGFTDNLHGGAIATMVDVACALAAARATDFDPEKESLVTADMHIRYLGRPKTEQVVAKADVVRIGSQLIVIECKVYDEEQHIIAAADLSMMRVAVRQPLQPEQAKKGEN